MLRRLLLVFAAFAACGGDASELADASADGPLDASVDSLPAENRRIPDSLTPRCMNQAGAIADCSGVDVPNQDGLLVDPAPNIFLAFDSITDRITTLEWDNRSPRPTPLSHEDARIACEQLFLKEGMAWRLPTAVELGSLLDYGKNGSLLPDGFAASGVHWVSDPAVVVDADSGAILPRAQATAEFMCVRGLQLSPTFTSVDSQQFDERLTRLRWNVSSTTGTWVEAMNGCPAGTRPPTIKELLVLLEAPASAPSGPFWSSTPSIDSAAFEFGQGVTSAAFDTPKPGLCVEPID